MANDKSRARVWATVVYPESAPKEWLSVLSGFYVPCFVSPLHDCDLDESGQLKKSHYHVLFTFDGKKSVDQVRDICAAISGVGVERVGSVRGYARYLCHLDNPDKHQYSPDDVQSFAGADYFYTIGIPSDRYASISEMRLFCEENDLFFYSDLFDYACKNRPDWFRCLCDNGTYVMYRYLTSREYKSRKEI